ncbi:hypothetical protein [Arthrobacter sp. StoSoilB20]|uniref:hypothetical protein n=1 Tax=Arthrobacter sp. StoSoilB20 TaxID=2830995 RepID=UPI001CC3F829|nr:hypothetical protein [Arthrobacter sp. StoSoilB20]BCW59588.1 hypothetical protein StoSoilB20_29350 [Arthrobacter sp. StoSoilB20]
MPYDYSHKQISQYDWPAMATTYRLKFEHAQQEATHWMRRAQAAEAQLSMYQQRERQA